MSNIKTRIQDHKTARFDLQLDQIDAEHDFIRAYERCLRLKNKIMFHTDAIKNLEQKESTKQRSQKPYCSAYCASSGLCIDCNGQYPDSEVEDFSYMNLKCFRY